MGLGIWLTFGLVIGLGASLVVGIDNWLGLALLLGFGYGVTGGLGCGLFIGRGNSIILHFTLRAVLARTNRLPWRLVPFLDYCVERIFLRRVGGGYIFVHRLLQEHFASLTLEDIERLATNADVSS